MSLRGALPNALNVMLAVEGASGLSFGFFRPALGDRGLADPARFRLSQAGLAGREAGGRSPTSRCSSVPAGAARSPTASR